MNSSTIAVLQAAFDQQDRLVRLCRERLETAASDLAEGLSGLRKAEAELSDLRAGLDEAKAAAAS